MSRVLAASVIVPAHRAERTIGATLAALRAQGRDDFETLVVDSSPDEETARLVAARFPEVRLLRSPERLDAGTARNRGAAAARGRLLVFLDADCAPRAGWLDALEAAAAGRPVVGAALAPAGPSRLARPMHICKFSAWLAGGPEGPRDQVPSAATCVTRNAWERFGPFADSGSSEDTALGWRARDAGTPPWFEPRAVVDHQHVAGLGSFLRERIDRGRAQGRLRPVVEDWSRARLAGYVAAMPLVSLVATARCVRWAARSGQLAAALAAAPVLVAGWACWSAGEAGSHLRLLAGRR